MNRLLAPVRNRAGLSMIEIVVAMAVLSGGIFAISGGLTYGMRQANSAEFRSDLQQVKRYATERIRGLPYDSVRTDAIEMGGIAASWTVEQDSTFKRIELITEGALLTAGTAKWNADTVVFEVPRP